MKKILIIQNKRIGDVLIASVIANNFKKKYPDSENPLSSKSDKYNKLVIEAYGGKFDDIINENKIIKNIVKETSIDKDLFSV
jgi:hypothetical protein